MNTVTYKPAVVALNGPPGSGKGWLTENVLKELIPDAVLCKPSDYLYGMMIIDGLIPDDMPYDKYKELPYARASLIEYATAKRAEDPNTFSKKVTDSIRYNRARVVILDNFGFDDEVLHFHQHSNPLLVLRLDTQHRAAEPYRAKSRRIQNVPWANDSRSPVFYHNILTAYDSIQMAMLLRWLSQSNLTREAAGPYNEVRDLWIRHFLPSESTGDLFKD